MQLIFLRHGTASSKSPAHTELDDFKRELVREGRKEIKRMMRKYPEVFKNIDMIFSSPFLRALETAEILYRKYPSHSFELSSLLESQNSPEMVAENITMENNPKVCFVGHEPLLTGLVKILLKSPDLKIDLVKGGAILLEGDTLDDLQLSLVLRP